MAVVILVLVVIDVALVGLALGRNAPEQNGPAGSVQTYTTGPSPSPSPSSPATIAPSADVLGSGRRMLSAVTATEAWRAAGGSCGNASPVLEHTMDGGASWRRVELNSDVASIVGLRASTSEVSILAGSGPDCSLAVHTTRDGGATWTNGEAGAAGPGINAAGVVLAGGSVGSPCADPIDAFQGKSTTVIICDGMLEWRTGTAQWVEVQMDGVRSVTVDGNSYTIARVGADGCAGVRIDTMSAVGVTPASMTQPVGCRPETVTNAPVEIDRVGRDLWLWVGQSVAVSHDGGVTW